MLLFCMLSTFYMFYLCSWVEESRSKPLVLQEFQDLALCCFISTPGRQLHDDKIGGTLQR